MKSCAILFCPVRKVNHPFVQHFHAVVHSIIRLPVCHSITVLMFKYLLLYLIIPLKHKSSNAEIYCLFLVVACFVTFLN